MWTRAAILVVFIATAATGCGGGGSKATGTSTGAATTTTVVTAEAFTASMCAAGTSVANATPGAAGGYKLLAETYAKVTPTPEKKADLDAFVEANRALGALWSDPNPITPEAFSDKQNQLTDTYLSSFDKLRVECPAQPGTPTTAATEIRAQTRLYSVARADQGQGLWWYTSFGCPEGTQLQLGADMVAVPGEPLAAAVRDAEAGAADPFTGVVANDSYGRIDKKISATCV